MILAAISLAAILGHSEPKVVVTCHKGAISYKFVGAPGTHFTYAGEPYTVPPRGSIELISGGPDAKYVANGRELPLDVWPMNEFGTRTVPLPKPGGLDDTRSAVR